MRKKHRCAFTLVEMLVVISIIGTLVSLLLPAVQYAREIARRMQCSFHLQQLAIATHSFEAATGRFPGFDNQLPAGTMTRRVGWFVEFMPQLDQQPIYDQWTDGSVATQNIERPYFPVLVCSSRGSVNTDLPVSSYIANAGMWIGDYQQWTFPQPYNDANNSMGNTTVWWSTMREANGLFVDRWTNPKSKVVGGNVGDGRSNTIMYSENLQAAPWDYVTNLPDVRPNPDQQARLGTTMLWLYTLDSNSIPTDANKPAPNFYIANNLPLYGEAKINGLLSDVLADRPSICRPSSNHHGVVVVAFADARVVTLSQEMDYHVYTQLLTPNGRRSDAPYASYLLKPKDFEQ